VLTGQRPWGRVLRPPRLREETDLHRLGEDLVRVVSETLHLDAAGACVFSYLLKAEPDGYSDGLYRTYAPIAPGPSHGLSTLQQSVAPHLENLCNSSSSPS
jgi:hypothetical protein